MLGPTIWVLSNDITALDGWRSSRTLAGTKRSDSSPEWDRMIIIYEEKAKHFNVLESNDLQHVSIWYPTIPPPPAHTQKQTRMCWHALGCLWEVWGRFWDHVWKVWGKVWGTVFEVSRASWEGFRQFLEYV